MVSESRPIRCSLWRWWRLISELRRRGGGVRESGAFLLGREGQRSRWVTSVCFYDDIDAHALTAGYVRLSGAAVNQVWDACARSGLQVLADMHTHPTASGQSQSDQEYPMVAMRGHTALIVPNLARSAADLSGVGVYRYLGSKTWRVLPAPRLRGLDILF
jgi:hypothetical protein